MDFSVAWVLGLPVQSKFTLHLVETIDGSSLASGLTTQETVPLEVVTGEHWEVLPFNLIFVLHSTLILRAPWLIPHDPHILWSQCAIAFLSSFCRENCFSFKNSET